MIGDLLQVTDTMSLAEYGKLMHYGATVNFVSRLDLEVTNLVIDATGSIDATGKGYIGGGTSWHEYGRTLGNVYGASDGTGGSYGGVATGYQGRTSNVLYGSLTNPTDLGSGGGTWDSTPGGAGGGSILIKATNLQVDGAIRANGGQSAGSAAGDGSGGTVNIITGNLSGIGTIQAKGGGDGVGSGGGGGRIAVTYSGSLSLPEQNISAIGGTGQYGSPGGNGTVYLKHQGQTYGNLIIDGYNRLTPAETSRIPGGYVFDNVTVRNNAQVVADDKVSITGTLLVTGNSVLTHGSGNEEGLVIDASIVQVDQGSSIDVTGRGYPGGGTSWHEYGRTLGNILGSADGAGGSYGGLGAGYQSHSSYLVYGDPKNPVSLGSGGGTWDSTPSGAGGGRITINNASKVLVDGVISANGANSSGSAAGGGSGGSVLIHTSLLSGNGFIQANGGGNGPGGGGGRVAVFCGSVDPVNNLNNLYNITAFNGRGNYADRPATAGTVYIKQIGGEDFLYIDDNVVDVNGVANGTAAQSTPLTPIGFGTTSSVTDTSLVTDGLVSMIPGGLVGLRINPDVGQNETFAIQMNTNNTIMVVSPNEHGVGWSSVAGAGKTYAGFYEYDNVIFTRGGNLVVGDMLDVKNTMNISEYGLLTHYGATTTATSRLDLTVGNLVIDVTGRINADGKGYIGGGPAWNESGTNAGQCLWGKGRHRRKLRRCCGRLSGKDVQPSLRE